MLNDSRKYGRTDGRTDRWADMTKLKVAFRNFGKAPENYQNKCHLLPFAVLLRRSYTSAICINVREAMVNDDNSKGNPKAP